MRFVRNSLLKQELSVLGFGAAAVLGRVGRRDSLIALSAALDAGINVFDTARSYGYGESEALLGEFLQGRRSDVVLSSKFGIVPAKQSPWKQAAKPVARAVLQLVPALAKSIRGQAAGQLQPGQFTVATLEASVAVSLKKLRTDYLDILFMHEATLDAVQDYDLLRAMERLVETGKVRLIGVSADPEIAAVALEQSAVKAIQFACHIGNSFASRLPARLAPGPLRFSNHPFGGVQGAAAMKEKFAATMIGQDLPPALREKLVTGDRHSVLADLVLNNALIGNDVVLATMMNPDHLRTNALAVSNSRFDPAELLALRQWLTAECPVEH